MVQIQPFFAVPFGFAQLENCASLNGELRSLFLRRAVYEKFGPYDVSYRIAGDFELVARVFARGGIRYAYLEEVLVRMPRGGISTSGPRATWTITREMRRACAQNAIPTNYFKLLSRLALKAAEFVRPRA